MPTDVAVAVGGGVVEVVAPVPQDPLVAAVGAGCEETPQGPLLHKSRDANEFLLTPNDKQQLLSGFDLFQLLLTPDDLRFEGVALLRLRTVVGVG